MSRPQVSFAVACYNSAPFLREAVESALAQRGVSVEVLIVDDHSADGSDRLAERMAAEDQRVSFHRTPHNGGPAAARNIALDQARGEWFAILDSDDLLHPDRAARLLAEATASGADLIADDLLLFDDGRIARSTLFLDAARASDAQWIELAAYLDETRMYGRRPNLGFLKPMIRREFLTSHAIRYDETLRVAEDDALILACLGARARYRLQPHPLYYYRKHGGSITHRLQTEHIDRMREASDRLLAAPMLSDAATRRPLRRRAAAMRRAWAFTHLIDALQRHDLGKAVRLLRAHPDSAILLRMPIGARLRRLLPLRRPAPPPARGTRPAAVIISKQRVAGATNGSSAYLLAVAEGFRDAGFDVHLVQPSSTLFGRMPFFKLKPELDVFASHRVAGAFRIGRWLVARYPRIAIRAALSVASRIARRVGLHGPTERPAPYAVATPWTRVERLFVANCAALRPDVVLADYVFQVEALPFLLAPAARSAVVMHDLFHTRAGQFGPGGDSVAALDEKTELAMLGGAEAVLCIQASEAGYIANALPESHALLVPMPVLPVAEPAPGDGDRLLFVGSNTAPNVLGLQWFLDTVWPLLAAERPTLRLDVAGSVRAAIDRVPTGVAMLGLVDDLTPLYAQAGIVISPLLQGSGLKIKLIEALARGKAAVVSAATLQGVEWLAKEAVVRADAPHEVAAAILTLASDDAARGALAAAALAAARDDFSTERCFSDLRAWLASPRNAALTCSAADAGDRQAAGVVDAARWR